MLRGMTEQSRSSERPDENPVPGSESTPPASSRSDSGSGSGSGSRSNSDSNSGSDADSAGRRRGPPPNPLYHPLFLPVLLVGYSLWFGYDGFLSPPDYEHRFFNQVMFGVTALIALWVVPRGIREFQRDREAAAHKQEPTPDPESHTE